MHPVWWLVLFLLLGGIVMGVVLFIFRGVAIKRANWFLDKLL